MLFALVYSCLRLLLDIADVRVRVRNPEAELLLLRHELRVLRRQINRPQLTSTDRLIMTAFHHLVSRPALGGLVEPETVLGWHRELVRRKWAAFGRGEKRRSTASGAEPQRPDLEDGSGESEL